MARKAVRKTPKKIAKPKKKVAAKAKAKPKAKTPVPAGGLRNSKRFLPVKPNKESAALAESYGLIADPVASEITKLLRAALSPSMLQIHNLAKRHAKHAEARKHGGGHYSLHVVSDLFTGLGLIQRQQWVYSLLDGLFKNKRIHALEMKLQEPDEVSTLNEALAPKE